MFDEVKNRLLEERLRPRAWSEGGFLGSTESLSAVIKQDKQTLIRLGISYEEIADALEKVLLIALDQYWKDQKESIVGHLQVTLKVYRGFQRCPWNCSREGTKQFDFVDFLLYNLRTKESVEGPGLIIHLIREHKFFEGIESPYRVDPERLSRMLEIIPGDT